MKAIVCEMCNSNDFLKQDGVFVCQSCGTKYSPEEAKKMMVEGTVDVSGSTVKVDDTAKIDNYYTMAENAYDASNHKEAENYCNKIIEIDPANYRAWLLKGRAAGWQSTLAHLRMEEFLSCTTNALTYASSAEILTNLAKQAYAEYYNLTLAINKLKIDHLVSYHNENDYMEYIKCRPTFLMWGIQIQFAYANALKALFADKPENEQQKPDSLSTMLGLDNLLGKCDEALISGSIKLWNAALKEYNSARDGYPSDYMLERMMKEGNIAMSMLGLAIPSDTSKIKAGDERNANIIKACKNLIIMKECWMDLKSYTVSFSGGVETHPISKSITMSSKITATADIRKYHDIIKLCDPTYEVPVVEDPKPQSSSGCYVATAVYGSYDCPQVWTLRRFRDYTLAETWYGRAFIHTYYAISPTLVKWFGNTNWFKNLWKPTLDRMVGRLNESGVEDTPYNDRSW